jgi:uncharacterized protein (TIRG00374 family)
MSGQKKKNMVQRFGLRSIGIILFVIVLSRMDWNSLGNVLQVLPIINFLLVIPFFIITFPVKSTRWFYILKTQEIRISMSQAFEFNTSAIYWGLLTPGKLGEFIKAYFLTWNGVSIGKAIFSVLLDRGMDVFFLLILSTAALLGVLQVLSWPLAAILLAASMVLFMVSFKYLKFILKIITPLITWIAKKIKKIKDPEVLSSGLKNDIDRFTPGKLGILLAISIISWGIHVVPLVILGKMLQLEIPTLQLVTAILLSSVVSMLPISVGGLGTRDSFLILYLGQYGVLKEKALLFSFMFIYMYLVVVIFSWLVYMISDIKKTEDRRQMTDDR